MPEGTAVENMGLPLISRDDTAPGGEDRPTASEEEGHPKPGDGKATQADVSQLKALKVTEEAPKPFLLSEGLPPVPAKLVGRILKGDFIDMSELLRDNLEAQRRGVFQEQSAGTLSVPAVGNRIRREVPDLLSWVQCFGIYTAVLASKYPERVQKLLAYQTLIIREARRCGGKGWLSYDTYFRQQMVGEWRGDEWGRLNPYLFSSTFMALGGPQRLRCSLCLEADHREEDCALAKTKIPSGIKQSARKESQQDSDSHLGNKKSPRSSVHFTWNQGEYLFPYCKFRHSCVRCGGDHKIIHCRLVGAHGAPPDRRSAKDRDSKEGNTRSSQ